MKLWFHQRLQVHLDHGLGDPISYGRNAQTPLASVLLRYSYRSNRRRKVRPRRHAIPNLVEVVLELPLERLDGFGIYSTERVNEFETLPVRI